MITNLPYTGYNIYDVINGLDYLICDVYVVFSRKKHGVCRIVTTLSNIPMFAVFLLCFFAWQTIELYTVSDRDPGFIIFV